MSEKTQSRDPLASLKLKGYCRSFTHPDQDLEFRDLVIFAQAFLCRKTGTLFKDPIWEEYTEEEILIEYFSYLFMEDEKARQEFEAEMNFGAGIYGEDIYEWLEKAVEKNQLEMKEKLESMPDRVSFSPQFGEDKEE